MLKVLVVDEKSDAGMAFLDCLASPSGMRIIFVEGAVQACKNVKTQEYDLILLGNHISRGDIYDVGLSIKNSKRNWGKPVVCLGATRGRAIKVANLLKPYSLIFQGGTKTTVIEKVRNYLSNREGTV